MTQIEYNLLQIISAALSSTLKRST